MQNNEESVWKVCVLHWRTTFYTCSINLFNKVQHEDGAASVFHFPLATTLFISA